MIILEYMTIRIFMRNQTQTTHAAVKDFFHSIPLFSGLPDGDIGAILNSSHVCHYKKGDHLFHQGDETDSLSIIKDGWLKLYRGGSEGAEGTARLYTRGDVLGEHVLLSSRIKNFFSAQALGDVCAINIPASVVKERAGHSAVIMKGLILELIGKMGKLHIENEHMALFSAPQRIACLLLRLSATMIGKGGTFTFPYDKSLAATQLGMTRETFSRALASLKKFGIGTGGSEITIESFGRLSTLCCSFCSLSTDCPGARCMTDIKPPLKIQKSRITLPPPEIYGACNKPFAIPAGREDRSLKGLR